MALEVGNIANNPLFESAISVTGADTYHGSRGNATWTALDTELKEQLLRKATDYIIATYGQSWSAAVKLATNPPIEMQRATAELALIARTTPLLTNITRGKKRVKVGPLEVEYDGEGQMQTKFVLASRMLAPLLGSSRGIMVKLYRC